MQTVLIVVHLLVVLALIGVVLLQKSEGGALGIGGGGGGGFMTSRGSANVLTRATGILAAVFFATSLLLSILAGWGRQDRSIIGVPQPGQTAPGAPSAPGGNILDQLKGSSGPQVPPAK
ncbi:MAG TPA: preprotein translocase subunit SecG [Xanthobacteraceae bacterium]|nr:preprotein translocase subunit SecG [Xanthobacteraceae bacterium]